MRQTFYEMYDKSNLVDIRIRTTDRILNELLGIQFLNGLANV